MAYYVKAMARRQSTSPLHWMLALGLLLAGAALYFPFAAGAQEASLEKQDQLRALYAELLLTPSDLDKNFAYVALAEELQDYESAIVPLERLLLTYPNASKIKLKLGEYYTKLGSNAAARAYFEEVAEDAGADMADKEQAKTYLQATQQQEAAQ